MATLLLWAALGGPVTAQLKEADQKVNALQAEVVKIRQAEEKRKGAKKADKPKAKKKSRPKRKAKK